MDCTRSRTVTDHYIRLRSYCDDLTSRVLARDEWRKRHPDWDTDLFNSEHWAWREKGMKKFETSFDPDDWEPQTSDILTVDNFLAIITVALAAYEQGRRDA